MSSYKAVKTKLSFKNDAGTAKKKKKKRKIAEAQEEPEQLEGWVFCDVLEDIKGPVTILSPGSDAPSILVAHEESESVSWQPLPPPPSPTDADTTSTTTTLTIYEPTDVSQVFVARVVAGTSKVSFKSAFDRYLGVDKFGVVTCKAVAVGPTEEWEVVFKEDGVSLKSVYDKFLKAEPAYAPSSSSKGKAPAGTGASSSTSSMAARADSESIGFLETLKIKIQAANKTRAKKQKSEEDEGDVDERGYEIEMLKKYHSWGGGRLSLTKKDVDDLKEARKGGRGEVLVYLKSATFAWGATKKDLQEKENPASDQNSAQAQQAGEAEEAVLTIEDTDGSTTHEKVPMPTKGKGRSRTILHDIDLVMRRRHLVGVVGPVGSGKSSLANAILGEMDLTSGQIAIRPTLKHKHTPTPNRKKPNTEGEGGEEVLEERPIKIAYASQTPWIISGTVKENILFGGVFEEERFWEVVRVCALERDLELLERGVDTVI
ncbi:Multidrug resistance-associated protein 9, partial [Quaeritorhiza haematococci]